MENRKQFQKAGENSQQYQAETIIVNQGVTEERVRAIYSELISSSLQAHTSDAYALANQRIGKLENNILPKLDKVDGLIQFFTDPAFQILLRKAQQAAAATEREDDYALLSELLVCHVQKGANRMNRAGIAQAIEIVDRIDNEALCALTVAHAIARYIPGRGDCREGLSMLNALFEKLLYQELPSGTDWLDHLDILGTIRVTWLSELKKFSELYASKLNGYACVGIKADSDDYKKAIEILGNNQISIDFLVPNECLEGYVRLNISHKTSIDILSLNKIPLEQNKKDAIKQVWTLYSKDPNLQSQATACFMNLWDSFESLHKVRLWWESIPSAFQITRVGQILAHTNAKRCSPNLPDLV